MTEVLLLVVILLFALWMRERRKYHEKEIEVNCLESQLEDAWNTIQFKSNLLVQKLHDERS